MRMLEVEGRKTDVNGRAGATAKALAVAVVLVALPAAAQTNYVITSNSQTYSALQNATVVSGACSGTQTTDCMVNGGSGLSLKDEGYVSISLGFTFPYYGNSYTSVGVSSNGVLLFGTSANQECDYSNGGSVICTWGSVFPDPFRTPHNVIAPWWSDNDGNSSGEIRYVKPSSSEIVIEFYDWKQYGSTSSFSFQVRLNASGLFQIHYGSASGFFSGSVGFEDDSGSDGNSWLSCGTSFGCSNSDWPANTLYTVGQPVQADLYVEEVNLSNMVKNGSTLTFDVGPKFRNFGQTAANNFYWRAFLSTDKVKDATDQVVYDSSTSGSTVSVSGAGSSGTPTATATGSATATGVTTGNYYVLVEADSTGVVTEFSETNNVGSTTNYFTFGVDLVATSIIGPSTGGPDTPANLQVAWFNQGTDPAGNVGYDILLSTDQVFDANDAVVGQGTKNVTGGLTVNEALTIVLPINVPGGEYYFGIRLDPSNAVAEASETNNVVFASSKSTIYQADLETVSADLVDFKRPASRYGPPTSVSRPGWWWSSTTSAGRTPRTSRWGWSSPATPTSASSTTPSSTTTRSPCCRPMTRWS
jgi:hypothetical protein